MANWILLTHKNNAFKCSIQNHVKNNFVIGQNIFNWTVAVAQLTEQSLETGTAAILTPQIHI